MLLDYKFLSVFGMDNVLSELRLVEFEVRATFEEETQHTGRLLDHVGVLKRFLRKVSSLGTGTNAHSSTLNDMATVSYLSLSAESTAASHSLLMRMYHYHILKAKIAFSHWLFVDIPLECRRMLSVNILEVSTNETWLHRLCATAYGMVEARIAECTFSTHDYGLLSAVESRSYTARISRKYATTESEKAVGAIEIIQRVLCSWTCSEDIGDWWRIWTIDCIRRCFGEETLALQATWKLYCTITKTSVLKGRAGRVCANIDDLHDFETVLGSHPMHDEDCLLRLMVTRLFRVVSLHARGDTIPLDQIPFRPDVMLYGVEVAQASAGLWDGKTRFRLYLLQVLDTLRGDMEMESVTDLQIQLLDTPARFSPFRKQNPEWCQMLGPDGPYFGDRIQTKGGLFSALVWRALTAGTSLALNGPALFADDGVFQETVQDLPQSDYVRRQWLRDSSKPSRSVLLASTYWANIDAQDWTQYVSGGDNDFWDTFKRLHNTQKKSQIFPHLGAVGAFELCADIGYLGYYDPPSIEHTAYCMYLMDSASLQGLRMYMDIPESDRSRLKPEEIRIALDDLHEYILTSTSEQEQADMGLDTVTLESLLARFYLATQHCHV